jgi:hypothetical protein
LGVALALGTTLWVFRRPGEPSNAAVAPTKPERAPTPRVAARMAVLSAPSPGAVGQADLSDQTREVAGGESGDPLTPPEIHVESGDDSERDLERASTPGTEPLVPPVIDLGELELGRGARPTAEPLVPPEIFVDGGDPPRRVPPR